VEVAVRITGAKDVIAVARARGFDVQIRPGPPPVPVLVRPPGSDRGLATKVLMGALRAWRLEIIEELSRTQLPE
jgi:hypothetical protein